MSFGIIYEGKEISLDKDKLIASGIFKTKKIEPPVEWTATRKFIEEHKDELIDLVFEDIKRQKEQMLRESVLKQSEIELENSKAILKSLRGE